MKPEIKIVSMKEQEMLESLQQVYYNFSFYHDRKTYQEIYVLLTQMINMLRFEFEIEYPTDYLEETISKCTDEYAEFNF